MIELRESENYYLYLDESGNFKEDAEQSGSSLIGGVLCYDEEKSLAAAKNILAEIRSQYPAYQNCNFRHATDLPPEIKSEVKIKMLDAITKNEYGFIPIIFRQKNKVLIQDSTTTYIMFLVDGLVKLIQDCSFQKDFKLTVIIGGRVDTTDLEKKSKNLRAAPKIRYTKIAEILNEFNKYMTMAQVREKYSFKNKFDVKLRSGNDKENELIILGDYISNAVLTQKTFAGESKKIYQQCAKKFHVYSIAEEPQVEKLKRYMADDNYAMALFCAMGMSQEVEGYKTFSENFKLALKKMPTAEKSLALAHFGQLLQRLLEIDRDSGTVINLIDKTINFVNKDCLGECYNEFMANLQLYKMAAITHLGKVQQFRRIAEEKFLPAVKQSGNLELYVKYVNRQIVYLQDVFNYEESLKIGGKIVDLLQYLMKPLEKFNENELTNFRLYDDQYFKICGSLALTCYFTLNQSEKYLELARDCSDAAINGFSKTADKQRQFQLRAQIEAEVGNFEKACAMLDAGLNITYAAPQPAQFKNFKEFDWYHFAKFSERLLKSAEYTPVAAAAIKIARKEFLNYRAKLNAALEHPDYITFSKMALCFDILGDSAAIQLHEEALRGVDAEIGENISVNANAAAFRLVILASALLTFERNNLRDRAATTFAQLQKRLAEYFDKVTGTESLKLPFVSWNDAIKYIQSGADDKLEVLEEMSRSILL